MNHDDPRHGTNAGALAHARSGVPICDPCRTAASRRRKANSLARHNGRHGRIPLGEKAYQIVTQTPRNQLAQATGYKHERIRRYELGGPTMRVTRETKAIILNAGKPRWTAIGIQRRLQALSRLGYSGEVMQQHCGVYATTLHKIRRKPGGPKFVRLETAEPIVAMFDRLQLCPAPTGASATETRNHAEAMGWVSALAWDDIDDIRERPKLGRQAERHQRRKTDIDEAVVLRVLGGEVLPMTTAERFEVMARWLARGGTERALCERMNWKEGRYSQPYVVGNVSEPARRTPRDGEAAA